MTLIILINYWSSTLIINSKFPNIINQTKHRNLYKDIPRRDKFQWHIIQSNYVSALLAPISFKQFLHKHLSNLIKLPKIHISREYKWLQMFILFFLSCERHLMTHRGSYQWQVSRKFAHTSINFKNESDVFRVLWRIGSQGCSTPTFRNVPAFYFRVPCEQEIFVESLRETGRVISHEDLRSEDDSSVLGC